MFIYNDNYFKLFYWIKLLINVIYSDTIINSSILLYFYIVTKLLAHCNYGKPPSGGGEFSMARQYMFPKANQILPSSGN